MRTGQLSQRYYGHYIASVVDVDDPDHLGRIRVQADQFSDTSDQPIWASIVRPSAGDKTGVYFTPKNGDQVILGFIAGDVREPIVLGYAHSSQNAPDTSLVDTQKHGIVTTIGSVVFDEQNGTITVTLVGPTQSVVTMDKNSGITIDYKGTPESTVTLGSSGIKLDFQGPPEASITLDSSGITLSAQTISIGDSSSMSIQVAGQGVVLTPFVEEIFATHTHATAAPGPPVIPVPPGIPIIPNQTGTQ
jgi:hypothetical protein